MYEGLVKSEPTPMSELRRIHEEIVFVNNQTFELINEIKAKLNQISWHEVKEKSEAILNDSKSPEGFVYSMQDQIRQSKRNIESLKTVLSHLSTLV